MCHQSRRSKNNFIAKILVNRLRPHLQNIICPSQGDFVKGRESADLFLLGQETLHSMNASKSKIGWIIIKLDVRKAFDTISWTFIIDMLKVFNIPPQWITLLAHASQIWNILQF